MRSLSARRIAAATRRHRLTIMAFAVLLALASVGALLLDAELTRASSSGGADAQEQSRVEAMGEPSPEELAQLQAEALAKNDKERNYWARQGCWYPGVCFYKKAEDWFGGKPTAVYVDAGDWQKLGKKSAGAYAVVNSRRDDGVLLYMKNNTRRCVSPGEMVGLVRYPQDPIKAEEYVIWIRISDSPTCDLRRP